MCIVTRRRCVVQGEENLCKCWLCFTWVYMMIGYFLEEVRSEYLWASVQNRTLSMVSEGGMKKRIMAVSRTSSPPLFNSWKMVAFLQIWRSSGHGQNWACSWAETRGLEKWSFPVARKCCVGFVNIYAIVYNFMIFRVTRYENWWHIPFNLLTFFLPIEESWWRLGGIGQFRKKMCSADRKRRLLDSSHPIYIKCVVCSLGRGKDAVNGAQLISEMCGCVMRVYRVQHQRKGGGDVVDCLCIHKHYPRGHCSSNIFPSLVFNCYS